MSKSTKKTAKNPKTNRTPKTSNRSKKTRTGPKQTDQSNRRGKKTRAAKTTTNDRPADTEARERLQKVLARAGLGSRRKLETRIEAGDIRLDGQVAELGATVGEGSLVEMDGRRWRITARPTGHRTLIYHKPEGEVTTRSDPEGRPTVFNRLPRLDEGRWIAVGRLDINTAGLLVLTTDGELANRMMHPSGQVDREYLCRIRGHVDEEQVQQLLKGVQLDDGPARFTDVVAGEITEGHSWYTVALMEGRYREVRRLWEAVGTQVARLKRVRFGPVFLPARVRSGQYEELTPADHRILREDVGLPSSGSELVAEGVSSSR